MTLAAMPVRLGCLAQGVTGSSLEKDADPDMLGETMRPAFFLRADAGYGGAAAGPRVWVILMEGAEPGDEPSRSGDKGAEEISPVPTPTPAPAPSPSSAPFLPPSWYILFLLALTLPFPTSPAPPATDEFPAELPECDLPKCGNERTAICSCARA
jgi:hypothetical protein